ncbi:MAG TPA: hypothetical protein DCE56_30005 [Cyanobacteria bacterium UBA8553]|nr:hypothetical protein [Cyanobacteria bacterium UBA8553]HAJ62526.1 hypothetical protein [Cyanobacteria bacterium UBA8543]
MQNNDYSTIEVLAQAYEATTYRVKAPEGDILIRIGLHNPELDLLLNQYNVDSWAFITAWNPASVALSLFQNHQRHTEMLALLHRMNVPYLDGIGMGDDTDWPPEQSVIIFGLNREEARKIGALFGQNAIVYGECNGLPELLWCLT